MLVIWELTCNELVRKVAVCKRLVESLDLAVVNVLKGIRLRIPIIRAVEVHGISCGLHAIIADSRKITWRVHALWHWLDVNVIERVFGATEHQIWWERRIQSSGAQRVENEIRYSMTEMRNTLVRGHRLRVYTAPESNSFDQTPLTHNPATNHPLKRVVHFPPWYHSTI